MPHGFTPGRYGAWDKANHNQEVIMRYRQKFITIKWFFAGGFPERTAQPICDRSDLENTL
jgi:hypothetical protein